VLDFLRHFAFTRRFAQLVSNSKGHPVAIYSNGENSTPLLAQAFVPESDLPKQVRVIVSSHDATGTLQLFISPQGGPGYMPGQELYHYVYLDHTTDTWELDFGKIEILPGGIGLRVEITFLSGFSGQTYATIVVE
jgi:hypothetical protein